MNIKIDRDIVKNKKSPVEGWLYRCIGGRAKSRKTTKKSNWRVSGYSNQNTNKQKKQNAKIIFNEARFNDIYLESLHLHRN